jgi:hypothetical protein
MAARGCEGRFILKSRNSSEIPDSLILKGSLAPWEILTTSKCRFSYKIRIQVPRPSISSEAVATGINPVLGICEKTFPKGSSLKTSPSSFTRMIPPALSFIGVCMVLLSKVLDQRI